MANNRMYIRCEVDGQTVGLAKAMAAGWYVRSGLDMTAELNAFFAEHAVCSLGYGNPRDAVFRIVYETGDPELGSPLAPPPGVETWTAEDERA